MNKITVQDIVTKRLNTTLTSPDDLICDAYYKMAEAEHSMKLTDKVEAYISALVALEANNQCGIKVPNLERLATDCLDRIDMTTEDIADFYLKNENLLTSEN